MTWLRVVGSSQVSLRTKIASLLLSKSMRAVARPPELLLPLSLPSFSAFMMLNSTLWRLHPYPPPRKWSKSMMALSNSLCTNMMSFQRILCCRDPTGPVPTLMMAQLQSQVALERWTNGTMKISWLIRPRSSSWPKRTNYFTRRIDERNHSWRMIWKLLRVRIQTKRSFKAYKKRIKTTTLSLPIISASRSARSPNAIFKLSNQAAWQSHRTSDRQSNR